MEMNGQNWERHGLTRPASGKTSSERCQEPNPHSQHAFLYYVVATRMCSGACCDRYCLLCVLVVVVSLTVPISFSLSPSRRCWLRGGTEGRSGGWTEPTPGADAARRVSSSYEAYVSRRASSSIEVYVQVLVDSLGESPS